jgi:Predicted membrane protein (DUF2207) C-terminal domain
MTEGRQIALLFAVTMALGLVAVALAYPFRPFPSLDHAAALFVLGTPFLFLLLYIVHGREPDETVPRYLSGVPNPARKPWVVNLVFRGDTFESTDDAFYATVLDLQRSGYVALIPEPDGQVRMRILKDRSEDPYEQNVLTYLGFIAEARIPAAEQIGQLFTSVFQDRNAMGEIGTRLAIQWLRGGIGPHSFSLGTLIRPPQEAVLRFFDDGRRRVIPVLGAAAAFYFLSAVLPAVTGGQGWLARHAPELNTVLVSGVVIWTIFFITVFRGMGKERGLAGWMKFLALLFLLGIFLSGIVLSASGSGAMATPQLLMCAIGLQCLATMLFPPTLLGRWKVDTYREKLQWDAFRAFLSDMVKIREYSHADQAMWGDWLIFGTALGVGDGVVAAMEDLHIQIPAAEMGLAIQTAVMEYAQTAAKDGRIGGYEER